ncbi:DNA-binding response OmpR family regulator [Nocardioides cavernae]|uniref:DNA-binding response OmpR family regulator n=1 Tax=Nocardioides cavernae TaxID=1921566 RepID=A0A7Y9KU14_9ACTN|nr:response regulator transcription factor [Nocardioides cavernae]NYE38142.1 DNA-binding response OmpR family regulator [Nocardioides cavernae]
MGHRLAVLLACGGLDSVHVTSADQAFTDDAPVSADLVLIESDPPHVVGVAVCSELRRRGHAGGIVIVGDHYDELAVVAALDAGADDVVSQPWTVAELLSRVRAVLRRLEREGRSGTDAAEALSVDDDRHSVRWGGVVVTTTGREHEVLLALIAHRGRVVTHEELMRSIWGPEWSGSPMVLSAAVTRLRSRLAAAGAPDVIENVRGVGFRLSVGHTRGTSARDTGSIEGWNVP